MRIRYIVTLFTIIVIFLFNQPVFAGTKYDRIIADPSWKKLMVLHQNTIAKNRIIMDYLNLLVNKNDLRNLIKRGELEKEKAKFVEENLDDFTIFMQLVAVNFLNEDKADIKDSEFVYITGVIKSPKAQAAKTSTEYQMEKELLRGFYSYRYWEVWREEGFLKQEVSGRIDKGYKIIQKNK